MGLDTLVCLKRVPDVSGEVLLTEDAQSVDGRYVGFTISPHESCAVESAVQVRDATGEGSVTLFTLGPPEAVEQLRSALGVGATAAVHVEADGSRFGPADVATEIAAVVRDHEGAGTAYDLVLLGNDAADSGDFQVPVRLAHLLGRPVVTGIKNIAVENGILVATADAPDGGTERYEVPLPAVVAMMEGGVEPRYPTIKGRMAAKKVQVETRRPTGEPIGASRIRLRLPPAAPSSVQVLGEGPGAAAAVVDLFAGLGVS